MRRGLLTGTQKAAGALVDAIDIPLAAVSAKKWPRDPPGESTGDGLPGLWLPHAWRD